MTMQQQEHKRFHRKRWLIVSAVLLFIAIGTIIWILTSRSVFTTVLPIVIFTVLGILIALFQWLFPISSSTPEHSFAHLHAPQVSPEDAPAAHQMQPIIVHVPATQPLSPPSPFPEKALYRGIIGSPLSTDQRAIQQREHVVREVYAKLVQPDITAIALTGIGGVGKSTLAALVYHFAEEQRRTHNSVFLAETLWLTVDSIVTFADLAGNLFEAFGKPLPDLNNLAPQNQAVALYNVLNTTDKPRLIILDQFENLLNWDDGHTLTDRPGVGEWLDIINSQPSISRILLTSRPRPIGTREYIPTYLQEYPVGGLEINEGVALLRNQGVVGADAELQIAVSRCAGHAFSLALLASLMRDHRISLNALINNSVLWTGDIAINLLDQIYTQRLSEVQRHLLLAFSLYREPVPFEAAKEAMLNVSSSQVSAALKALLTQHLLEAVGEGRYQLHAIIADYAQSHFEESLGPNEDTLQVAHFKAAQYYLRQAVNTCPPREQRRKVSDIHELIEALWQYCQAGKLQEAFELVEREGILSDLGRWGGNAILSELCHLLLSSDSWHPDSLQEALIYRSLASASSILGQREYALQYYERALGIYRDLSNQEGERRILNHLGNEYTESGQNILAQQYYRQALNISKEIGNRIGEAMALTGLAWTYRNLKQRKEALRYYKWALRIRREMGDRRGEAETLNGLGLVHIDLGKHEEALKYLEQALHIRTEVGGRREEAGSLNNLGLIYAALGERERAIALYEESLRIRREIGDRLGEGKVNLNIGKLYFRLENYSAALAFFLVAKNILSLMNVPDRDSVQRWIDLLSRAVGEHDFATLLATIEPRVKQIVDQALHDERMQ